MQFYPIKDLIKQAGSQRALAAVMGVKQNQISRWNRKGAYVSEEGKVFYPPESDYNPPLSIIAGLK